MFVTSAENVTDRFSFASLFSITEMRQWGEKKRDGGVIQMSHDGYPLNISCTVNNQMHCGALTASEQGRPAVKNPSWNFFFLDRLARLFLSPCCSKRLI